MNTEVDAFRNGPFGLVGWLRFIRPRQILALGFFLASFAALSLTDTIWRIAWAYALADKDIPGDGSIIIWNVTMTFGPAGVILMLIAARLGTSTARQRIVLNHTAPPVLYLRSFRSDRTPLGRPSPEEVFAQTFSDVGPVVGIGRPGELVPTIGAARMGVADSSWKDTVSDLIDRSDAVILQMGETGGFVWEMQQVVARCDPRRVVVFASPYLPQAEFQKVFEAFSQQIAKNDLLPQPVPEARIVTFDAEWTPQKVEAYPPDGCAMVLLVIFWVIPVALLSIATLVMGGPPGQSMGLVETGLMLVVAAVMACLPLMFLRPLEKMRGSARIGTALGDFFRNSGLARYTGRPFGKGTITLAAAIGGIVFLPLIAANAWSAGARKTAIGALCLLPLAVWQPVFLEERQLVEFWTGLTPFSGLDFAAAMFLAWPLYTPRKLRQHLAFGGARKPFWLVIAVLVLGAFASLFLDAPSLAQPM